MNTSFKPQRNPYVLGRPVNQALLFGRESLFVDIRHYLQQHKQVIVLYGQRRIGKSSVVRNITNQLQDLQENFVFVTFSLEYYSQQSLGRILAELAKEIISDLSLEQENIKIPEITDLESNDGVFSKEFLPQIYQALNGKNLVLLLDDFDIFINKHTEISLKLFYENLFSIIHNTQKLFVILLMDKKLFNISKKIRSFENIVTVKEIKLLDQNTTTNLINQPAQNILEYGDDAIQAIFKLSAGHPYFTQVICFAIFSRARENNKLDDKVNREDVEAIIDKAIELAEAGLSWFWEEFSILEKIVLSAVAESQETSEDYLDLIKANKADLDINLIIKTKEYLKENEFLEQTKDEKVKIELFRKWIRQTHPLTEEIGTLEKLTQKETQSDAQLPEENITGLTQKGTKVGVIHELPLRKNKVFSHILRKYYINENNNMELSQIIAQIIENTTTNTSNIHYEIEDRFFAKPYEIANQTTSNHEVNHEVNTRQKKPPILIIIILVCLSVSTSIILATIYRLYTQPCPAGEKKEFGIWCVVDNSRISRGDKTLFPNITNIRRDQGIQAFKKGDYQQAEKLFKQAIQANNTDVESRIYYNNALARQKGSPFTLAVVVPIDRETNNIAQEILRGVAQAQNQFNQNKGLNGRLLEIVIGNDSNNSNEAKAVVNAIIKDSSILGVIGHNSSDVTKSLLQDYEKAKLAIISPTATSADLKSSVFFRVVDSDKITGQKLANYVFNSLKLKQVVIFANPESAYSKSISEAFTNDFQKQGGEVVKKYSFNSSFFGDDIDESINTYKAEAAMLFPDTKNTGKAIEIAQANLDFYKNRPDQQMLQLLGGDTLYSYETLMQGGEAVEGMILSVPWFRGTSAAEEFAKKSKELWGGDVSWRTATSYDATQAFIKALSNNASRQTVLEGLKNVDLSANETSGYPLKFTDNMERDGKPVLLEVKNGKFVQIDESKASLLDSP
ncbi:ABC transporter substrate-binding protein [Sphaerospermopsis sp. FACHB-1094]|uniref:ABC transporter substrate-binding protein n=1 Tax=Sphaerospermopsis sp. FACHB-1094 TaxID=2692861 RepID=UPI00168A2326|nr:ABC transporter substrate-binding protein [Sphaerospermopsis sp. FACHB-1094]MBD2133869.1 ABC transporter substrate-binding protein [Sphaerospermopsis sp. FACHB-1094]